MVVVIVRRAMNVTRTAGASLVRRRREAIVVIFSVTTDLGRKK